MTALWTAAEAATATRGSSPRDWTASGVSIDSRSVQPGDLFVALSGPNFDGHDFVAKALEAGAAAAMVARVPAGLEDAPLLVVDETLEGLRRLGAAARARTHAQVAAVTGSVGKTGTKEMLRLALPGAHASVGSFNNHWGVPLSLARLPAAAPYGVFELGMNHAGEIAPLSALVRPHLAIVTTIAPVHLEFFASTAEIAEAKAEIFMGMGSGGIAVLPRDSEHFDRLAAAARARRLMVVSFGEHDGADVRLLGCDSVEGGSAVRCSVHGRALSFGLGVAGRQWAHNAMAVLAAVSAFGADLDHATRALGGMAAPKGRGERHQAGGVTIIDESYNASPVAAAAALATLAATPAARRIAVLGDMRELGPQGPALHAGLAEAVVRGGIDLVFTAGELMGHLREVLPADRRGAHAADSQALAPLVAAAVRDGDAVMVKGSASMNMGVVVKALLAQGRGN